MSSWGKFPGQLLYLHCWPTSPTTKFVSWSHELMSYDAVSCDDLIINCTCCYYLHSFLFFFHYLFIDLYDYFNCFFYLSFTFINFSPVIIRHCILTPYFTSYFISFSLLFFCSYLFLHLSVLQISSPLIFSIFLSFRLSSIISLSTSTTISKFSDLSSWMKIYSQSVLHK